MHKHSPPKARPKLGESCVQPQPKEGKTKTGGSLCRTSIQKDKDLGKPKNNHMEISDDILKHHGPPWELHGTERGIYGTS